MTISTVYPEVDLLDKAKCIVIGFTVSGTYYFNGETKFANRSINVNTTGFHRRTSFFGVTTGILTRALTT
jgi:hypothetical protein